MSDGPSFGAVVAEDDAGAALLVRMTVVELPPKHLILAFVPVDGHPHSLVERDPRSGAVSGLLAVLGVEPEVITTCYPPKPPSPVEPWPIPPED